MSLLGATALAAGIGAAGDLIGTAVNAWESHKNRKFSAKEAEKQRSWEKEMSNTAHQREMEDLQAAGLNPILGVSNGGASSPVGASAKASGSGNIVTGNVLGAVLSSASNLIHAANQKDYNEKMLSHKEKSLAERSRDKAVTNQLYDKSGKLISTAESLIRKL